MKVHIQAEAKSLTLHLPTRLIFSKTFLKMGLRLGKRYSDAVPDIPPVAMDALCHEIRRIKKVHGTWELVNIQSADGQIVQIIL